ncbi:MAG: methionine adenosyltransferase [Conexivisphaerales archaeon]|jgi:S-adenosylmethionine synthetase
MSNILTIEKDVAQSVEEHPTEFVERKGKGHPDTICDRASEELSIALSKYYIENYGHILHHNLDKCVLVGGQSIARFGGGEVLEPIYLLLVGRATVEVGGRFTRPVPLGTLVQKTTKAWMKESFRNLDVDNQMIVDCRIRQGSADLVGNYNASRIQRSNDTSFGVAFAPMSETEKIVFDTEQLLNSPNFKARYPAVGEDVKVMGLRRGDSIKLTVAAAIVSKDVDGPGDYIELKKEVEGRIKENASKITKRDVQVDLNTADDPAKEVFYLTVTGLSAEQGDDGQVGRGNRANGLITPFRPMTIEATSGKNPTSHVGKIYQVAARQVVDRIVEEVPDVEQVYCYMLSQIGKPTNEPQCVHVRVFGSVSEDKVKRVTEPVVADVLKGIPSLWEGFIQGKFGLY